MSLLHRCLSWDISLRRQDIQIQKFVPTKKKNPLMEFLRRCIQGKASKPHTLWMRKRKRFSFVIFLSSRCWIQQILWSSSYISVTPAFTVKVSFLGEFPLGHFSKLSLVFSSLLIYFLKEKCSIVFWVILMHQPDLHTIYCEIHLSIFLMGMDEISSPSKKFKYLCVFGLDDWPVIKLYRSLIISCVGVGNI